MFPQIFFQIFWSLSKVLILQEIKRNLVTIDLHVIISFVTDVKDAFNLQLQLSDVIICNNKTEKLKFSRSISLLFPDPLSVKADKAYKFFP